MKKIILSIPNSASNSLMKLINDNSIFRTKTFFDFNSLKIETIRNNKNFFLNRKLDIQILLDKLFSTSSFFYDQKNSYKFSDYNPVVEYLYLSQFHSDFCNINKRMSTLIDNLLIHDNLILKQHFPPTEMNKIYLDKFKKVILLRDTEGCLNKYKKRHPDLFNKMKNKLIDEIDMWKSGWMTASNILLINYDDLINDTYSQIKKIEEFFEIKINVSNDFKLSKINES